MIDTDGYTRGTDLPHQPELTVNGDSRAEPCVITFNNRGYPVWDQVPDGDSYNMAAMLPTFEEALSEAEVLTRQLVHSCHPLTMQFVRMLLMNGLLEWDDIDEVATRLQVRRAQTAALKNRRN